MKIQPLHDRVIVKRVEEEGKTKGGIIIPDTAKEKPIEGIVTAVGSGKRYAGTEINIEGEEHLIMKEEDIIAIVK